MEEYDYGSSNWFSNDYRDCGASAEGEDVADRGSCSGAFHCSAASWFFTGGYYGIYCGWNPNAHQQLNPVYLFCNLLWSII